MLNKLQPSQVCLNLIKRFESCDLKVYPDQNGFPTIGWGHKLTAKESFVEGITQATADYLLRCDVQSAANDVNTLVHIQLTQNQFDACVSFVFNIGGSRFRVCTMLIYLNSQRVMNAADEFLKWDHAAGRVSNGLETRREAERNLFLAPSVD